MFPETAKDREWPDAISNADDAVSVDGAADVVQQQAGFEPSSREGRFSVLRQADVFQSASVWDFLDLQEMIAVCGLDSSAVGTYGRIGIRQGYLERRHSC